MEKQSLKKNYVLNTAYQILVLVIPLITTPYISRVLEADGVGTYSYTNSVVAFFSLFAVLGTTTYGQFAIAQNRDERSIRSKLFWEIECLSILSTFVCVVLWILYILICPEYKVLFLILTLEIISAGADISWFYAGLEKFSFIVFRNSLIKIIGIVLLFALVKTKNDLWIYILILSGAKFLGNLSMWCSLGKFVDKTHIAISEIKKHLKETIAYFIPTITASVYTYLDKIMLGIFTESSVENGYYEQAQKIIHIAYTLIASINTVMSSRITFLFAQKNYSEIKDKLENAAAFIMTFGIAAMFGVSSIAYGFVPWFLGDGFEKTAYLMIIGSPLVVILTMHNFYSAQYLIPSGQRIRSTKGVVVGAGVNFIFNLILIPKFQSAGALIATLIAETAICVVYHYMSREYISYKMLLKYFPKQMISGMIMTAVIILIGKVYSVGIKLTMVQIIAGAVVYVVMLFSLKEQLLMTSSKEIISKIKSRIK